MESLNERPKASTSTHSTPRISGEVLTPTRKMGTGPEFSKTLVVTIENLSVKEFCKDEFRMKCLGSSPRGSSINHDKHSGKGKTGTRRQLCEEASDLDFEEDIIDGFAIASFSTLDDLEEFIAGSASGKLMVPKSVPSPSKTYNADESSESTLSSNEDCNFNLPKVTVSNHHASDSELVELCADSNHSMGSQETSAVDLSELDDQPPLLLQPEDVDMALSRSPKILSKSVSNHLATSVLDVSTSSSWEGYKLSTEKCMPSVGEHGKKESVKMCGCVSGKCGGCCKLSADSLFHTEDQKVVHQTSKMIESQKAVSASPVPISIKIEDSTPPPFTVHQVDNVSSKSSSSFSHYGTDSILPSNDHYVTKLPSRSHEQPGEKAIFSRAFHSKKYDNVYSESVKSRRDSPDHRGSSALPSPSLQRCHSRNQLSRHSIEIKSERSTPPPAVKKTSSHQSAPDRFTPRCSNPASSSSSYPLYTPAAVPASYMSVSNPAPFHYTSSFDSGLSYPFRSHTNPSSSLFAPPAVNINPSLMMGLQNQFGHDALLNAVANQEVLTRMQHELNNRFLHDRSILPLGLPSVPFTLHTEMHQHLHHHQHVVTPGYLPPSNAAGLFPNAMSMNLTELAERERFAKMAGLSGVSGLNMPPGLHTNGLSFNQGLHSGHSGAFQPKVPTGASASELLQSIRDHESLSRNPSISSITKRRGHWCSAHVQIAWKIHYHKHNKVSDAAAFRASLDAAEVASFRAGFGAAEAASLRAGLGGGMSAVEAASFRAGINAAQASTDRLRSGLLGGLAGGSGDLHPGLLGQGVGQHYSASSLDMLGRLAQTGLDLNNAALFRPPPVNSNTNILRPQAGPSSSMSSRAIASPAPQQHVKLKSDSSRRDIPSNHRSTPSSNHSHRSSAEVKSEHISNRHREHHDRPLSTSHQASSAPLRARSPTDHHLPRHRERSRSRSPLSSHSSRHPVEISSSSSSRTSDTRGSSSAKDVEMRIGYNPQMARGDFSGANMLADPSLWNGLPPSGHAFSSVSHMVRPPAAPKTHMAGPSHISALEIERDVRQQAIRQQQERERMSFNNSAAAAAAASGYAASHMLGSNCDAATALLLRDRMITDQRDRMLLAAAAAEYESRSLRTADHPGLRSNPMASFGGLYPHGLAGPHMSDRYLGGAGGMILAAAQSGFIRPSQSGPQGLKLPSSFGPMMDPGSLGNVASHMNLPFR